MKKLFRFRMQALKRGSLPIPLCALCLALLLPLLSGCSLLGLGGKQQLEPRNASEWYIMGEKNLESKDYKEAQTAFQKVLEEYTDNRLRIDALLQLADSYYANKQYIEASYQYKKFVELYPLHPVAPEAQFQVGMCNLFLMKSVDRDQTYTRDAVKAFERVITQYPDSRLIPMAKEGLEEARRRLAEHELYVGRFYFKSGYYESAISRLTNLWKEYPVNGRSAEILYMIGESAYHEESYGMATHYYKEILADYPTSSYTSRARKRLESMPVKSAGVSAPPSS